MLCKSIQFFLQQCLELRNYNSVMAIVVAALGSAPVRRLKNTKEVWAMINYLSSKVYIILGMVNDIL